MDSDKTGLLSKGSNNAARDDKLFLARIKKASTEFTYSVPPHLFSVL